MHDPETVGVNFLQLEIWMSLVGRLRLLPKLRGSPSAFSPFQFSLSFCLFAGFLNLLSECAPFLWRYCLPRLPSFGNSLPPATKDAAFAIIEELAPSGFVPALVTCGEPYQLLSDYLSGIRRVAKMLPDVVCKGIWAGCNIDAWRMRGLNGSGIEVDTRHYRTSRARIITALKVSRSKVPIS